MIVNLKSQTELSGLYIIYDGSVNIETEKERGCQHLLEHLVTKSFEHLMDDFDIKGIDWNAYTSLNNVVVHFTGLDDKLKGYKKDLINYLSDFKITKEEFENEKKIVIEEYKDSFSEQVANHYLNLDRKLFNNYNPIGSLSALENFTYLDCLNLFEKQFMKPSKIINVSKNSDLELDIDFAEPVEGKEYKYIENNEDFEMEKETDFKTKSSIICLSPFIDDDFQYVKIVNYMLGSGLNSPLYKEIREKRQLVYSVSLYSRRMNDRVMNAIDCTTSNNKVGDVLDTLKMIFDNRDKYLTENRFNIVKEMIKVNLTKQDINRYSSVNRWIEPDGHSLTPEFIDSITFERCQEVFDKYYDFSKYYKSIDKEEFKNN